MWLLQQLQRQTEQLQRDTERTLKEKNSSDQRLLDLKTEVLSQNPSSELMTFIGMDDEEEENDSQATCTAPGKLKQPPLAESLFLSAYGFLRVNFHEMVVTSKIAKTRMRNLVAILIKKSKNKQTWALVYFTNVLYLSGMPWLIRHFFQVRLVCKWTVTEIIISVKPLLHH